MARMAVEHTFESVELSAISDPRAAQTAGGMTDYQGVDMTTVPVYAHPALEVSGGAA